MALPTSSCPDCGSGYEPADNYCRQCGMYLAALRTMAVASPTPAAPVRYERERAALPAPVKKAVTAVAIGTALQVGMSLTGRYLARQAAKQAVGAMRPKAKARPERARPQSVVREPERQADDYGNAAAVSETIVIRRVWVRRP